MICPPDFRPLDDFFRITYQLENSPVGKLLLLRSIEKVFFLQNTYDDLINLYSAHVLAQDIFLTDGLQNTFRISSQFFDASFTFPGRFSLDVHGAWRRANINIAEEFNLGFRLSAENEDRLIDEIKHSAELRKRVGGDVTRYYLAGQVESDLANEAELDEEKVHRFFYQNGCTAPWVFYNRATNRIDFRLYEMMKRLEVDSQSKILDPVCHIWSEILKPFRGYFLCVSKNLVDDPLLLTKLVRTISEEMDCADDSAFFSQKRVGRRPSGAKGEYLRRYPNGKPLDVSFDAISAELSEAGFPISSRQVQNYERERKK